MGRKKFRVIFSPASQRELEKLEADDAIQLVNDIKKYLESFPLPIGKTRIKKLTGFIPLLYRIRSGDFRAYYRIIVKDIVVLAITHKKDSEKILKKLR